MALGDMDTMKMCARCRCAACHGPVGPRFNLGTLGRRATWKYPVGGNVLTGEDGLAVAIFCDGCFDARRPIVEAVEFTEAGPVYHPVEELEEVPYEGKCEHCKRDIGAGHESWCPYFTPKREGLS